MLLIGALLMLLGELVLSGNNEYLDVKPRSLTDDSNIDLVPHVLQALKHYKPCDLGCECHALTIHRDLQPYAATGITRSMIDQSRRFGILYQIIGGSLYRSKKCMYPLRCASVDEALLNIVRDLPDLEFILNVNEWPKVHFLSGLSGPVFSYSTTDKYLDIMCPAWSFWSSSGPLLQQYPHGLGRWDFMRQLLSTSGRRHPWQKKLSIGFFRGSRSSRERDNLVLLAKRSPQLVNARYTQSTNSSAQEVPFAEHCQFKYLFNFRGVSASFRLRHILLCKSLVLHVGEEWQEFFYSSLKPWIHYVPISSNASEEDLEKLILYLRHHDDLAEEIAERGYQFVWEHLRVEDIQCYWKRLLQEYAKLLSYEVEMELGFHEVLPRTAVQLYRGNI